MTGLFALLLLLFLNLFGILLKRLLCSAFCFVQRFAAVLVFRFLVWRSLSLDRFFFSVRLQVFLLLGMDIRGPRYHCSWISVSPDQLVFVLTGEMKSFLNGIWR